MLKPEMSSDRPFEAYKNLPDGVAATPEGSFPVANGDPGTGVNAPVEGFT